MEKIMKLTITIGSILVSSSVFYYLVFTVPNIERQKLRAHQEEINMRRQNLDECLVDVEDLVDGTIRLRSNREPRVYPWGNELRRRYDG